MSSPTDWVRGTVHLPGTQRIITCSWDGSLRLWNLESGSQIGDPWQDEGTWAQVNTIVLSPNGKTVASGSGDGTVVLWDVETGKVTAKWTGHTKAVWSICWSANGKQVLSGSKDGTARVRNVENIEMALAPIETGHEDVYAVIYSPDETKIATGGFNENAAKIWDTKTDKLIATLEHDFAVLSLAWTSDGNKLISGSYSSIKIFHTATWDQITVFDDVLHVHAITLSPNDRLLASVSWDKTARVWNLDTTLPVSPLLQHENDVACVAFSSDGTLLVTGCNRGRVCVWDIRAILKDAGLEGLLPTPDATAKKSLMDVDATGGEDEQLPSDFFDGGRDGVQYSTATRNVHHCSSPRRRRTPAPSFGSPSALLGRLSFRFRRPHSNTSEATELQQRPSQTIVSRRAPRDVVKVAAVRDRQTLFVAPRSRRDRAQTTPTHQQQSQSQTQSATALMSTTSAAPVTSTTTAATQSPSLSFWARLVLFLCCASSQYTDGNTNRTQQQQVQVQAQVSSSQTQPAAASTSATPPAPATITPGGASVPSPPLPLRARLVLFLCCASPPQANDH